MMEDSPEKQWAALVEILSAMLDGRIGLTEGCRAVVVQYYALETNNPLFNRFVGFDSESDAFAVGRVRELWAEDSLKQKDAERQRFEAHYRDWILEAAEHLLSYARTKCE